VKAGTPLGKEAQGYMDRGDLVPDSLIMGIMEQRLQRRTAGRGSCSTLPADHPAGRRARQGC